jgi:hypothetical protein
MKRTQASLAFTLCLLFVLAGITGCESNPTEPESGTFTTDASVDLGRQSISPSGGEVTISRPGDALDGLTIDIPKGAYSSARSFHISYAPITSHNFGSDFNLLTPLITISNGGGYADSLMTIKIPVSVPSGHFAMAFLYDRENDRLEGIPLLEAGSDHVTILTANFDHSSAFSFGKRASVLQSHGISSIVVASIPESSLTGDAGTGYQPGSDDWQFPDNITYVARQGISPGQAMLSIWYYVVRKKKEGAPALFGRYDNDGVLKTPSLWQDDVDGIKICSELSATVFTNTPFAGSLEFFREAARTFPDWHQGRSMLQQLAYSIRKSGDPQLVLAAGATERRVLVVYKVSGNTVYVADPAFPGDATRTLTFDPGSGKFQPYRSANNSVMTEIYYEGLSSVANWSAPADRFKRLDDRNVVSSLFPSYNLSSGGHLLFNGVKLAEGRVEVTVSSSDFQGEADIYNEQGVKIGGSGTAFQISGDSQRVGVHVRDMSGAWVGFRRLTIVRSGYRPPNFDRLFVSVKENGSDVDISSDPSFSYNFSDSSLVIDASKFDEVQFALFIRPVTGTGTYFPRGNDTARYWHVSDYNSELLNYGSTTITQWGNGGFAGTFSFDVRRKRTFTDSVDVHVEGSFRYPQ